MPDKRPDETNNAPEPPSIGDWTTLPESPDAKRPEAKRPPEEPPSIGDLPTLGETMVSKRPAAEAHMLLLPRQLTSSLHLWKAMRRQAQPLLPKL